MKRVDTWRVCFYLGSQRFHCHVYLFHYRFLFYRLLLTLIINTNYIRSIIKKTKLPSNFLWIKTCVTDKSKINILYVTINKLRLLIIVQKNNLDSFYPRINNSILWRNLNSVPSKYLSLFYLLSYVVSLQNLAF